MAAGTSIISDRTSVETWLPPRTVLLSGSLALLFIVAGGLFFFRLGERELSSSHEARAAQNAQMILDEGHWLLPRLFNQRLELQKPPLYYWMVAVVAWLRGGVIDGWTVRLPAALAALGCLITLFTTGWRLGRPRAGLFAALILATCVHFTWLARVGRIDMPLTFAVTLALCAFYLGEDRNAKRNRAWPWFLVGYLSLAVGVLLKGPVALILVAVVVGAMALARSAFGSPLNEERSIFSMGGSTRWWGMPLVLALTLPWYVWANIQTDNRLWEVFFVHHNFERGLGASESLETHPWWYYGPRLLVDLLPWSPLLIFSLWLGVRKFARQDLPARFGLCWFLAITLFLSCMGFKRADYLLPAYPGVALFLGCMIDRLLLAGSILTPRVMKVFLGSTMGLCVLGWGIYVLAIETENSDRWPVRRLAEEIRSRTKLPVIFFRAEAHALAFYVGRPLDTILEWENLDVWASLSEPVYVVMPPDCARDWPLHLMKGKLYEVLRTQDLTPWPHERPLVLLKTSGKLP